MWQVNDSIFSLETTVSQQFINHFSQGAAGPTYTLLHFMGRNTMINIGVEFVHKDV